MKTLNLFLKMHFTSLSPDGQPVSLAIVSSDYYDVNLQGVDSVVGNVGSKSFYAEFTDFDINRCDNWVKDNVLSKLSQNNEIVKGDSERIKSFLTSWFTQFSDYKLNFIVDCGWFCWGKFVDLMGEWDMQKEEITSMLANPMYDSPLKAHAKDVLIYQKAKGREMITETDQDGLNLYIINKTGLPKLPANFPPVPIDLNDLIMERKGFKSVADAFNMSREQYYFGLISGCSDSEKYDNASKEIEEGRFNSLFDAKVTKAIYEKLK